MTQEQQLDEFLKPLGYSLFKMGPSGHLIIDNLWQKEVQNPDAVCEENEKLFINIEGVIFKDETMIRIEVSISAERFGVWWRMMCYSLSLDELKQKLPMIENNLLTMFYGIQA